MYDKHKEHDMICEMRWKAMEHLADIMKKKDLSQDEIMAAERLAKMIHELGDEKERWHEEKHDPAPMSNNHGYENNGHHNGMAAYAAPAAGYSEHEEWGNANPEARRKFEALEHHYIGFWRSAADYARTGAESDKHRMLEHFKSQLMAHDEMAAFVKGNCPAACPEIGQILMAWKAKK